MPAGPRRHISLVETMRDKAPVWDRMVQKYALRPIPYRDIVLWPYGDSAFMNA